MLSHNVPRLDAPDRLWLVPVPVAKWLAAGLLSGPLANTTIATMQSIPQEAAWNLPAVWIVWVLGIVLSLVGAFVRPGGLHAARWAHVWVDYHLAPKRAVWKPAGE